MAHSIHMLATEKYIITTKDRYVDVFNFVDHKTVDIRVTTRLNEMYSIHNIALSDDGKLLAVTLTIKKLLVYDVELLKLLKEYELPRNPSAIRFIGKSSKILLADKNGEVSIYDTNTENVETSILGHLGLILDVLQTNDSKYVISSDRDEKIRVSCYPNTYNIQTYCLGHKKFVNHLQLLPHNDKYLTSASGDGTVKIWDYSNGRLHHTIDTSVDVTDDLKRYFTDIIDDDIEISSLPIIQYSTSSLNVNTSILTVTVYPFSGVLIYSLSNEENQFSHKLEHKILLENFPSAVQLYKDSVFVYDDTERCVVIYKLIDIDGKVTVETHNRVKMFENKEETYTGVKEAQLKAIKALYKRHYDNVEKYQERKRQRLEKTSKKD